MTRHHNYGEPTPALQRPEPDLPLREKVWCGIVLAIALTALGWIVAKLWGLG